MSFLSGRCDLFDHISFEKMYRDYYEGSLPDIIQTRLFELLSVTIYAEKERFSVPTSIIKQLEDEFVGKGENWNEIIYDEINNAFGSRLYSDLLECFEEFKRRTGGKIYQHKKVEVTEYNQKEVAKICDGLKILEHKEIVEDKRTKSGKKEITKYTYEYYNKEYKTLRDLNKKHVYVKVEIKFNTLLDLLPYLSYEICSCGCNEDTEMIYISNESAIKEDAERHLQLSGSCSDMEHYYREELSKLYLEVCRNYFLYDIENRTKIVPIGKLHHCVISEQTIDQPTVCYSDKLYDEHYFFEIDDEIDYMHDLEYVWKDNNIKPHWCAPKGVNNAIRLSKIDVENSLKEDIESGNLMIKYVAKPKNGFLKFTV